MARHRLAHLTERGQPAGLLRAGRFAHQLGVLIICRALGRRGRSGRHAGRRGRQLPGAQCTAQQQQRQQRRFQVQAHHREAASQVRLIAKLAAYSPGLAGSNSRPITLNLR
jgi:hypothetical protein